MTCRFEPAFMVRGEGWQKRWFLGGRGRGTMYQRPHFSLAWNDLPTRRGFLLLWQYGATLRTRPRGERRDSKGTDSLAGDSRKRRPHSRIPLSPRTTCQRRGRPSAAHGSTAQRSEPARVAEKGFQRDNSLAGDSRNGVLTPAFPSRPERPVNAVGGPPPPTAVRRIAPNPPAGRERDSKGTGPFGRGFGGRRPPRMGDFQGDLSP